MRAAWISFLLIGVLAPAFGCGGIPRTPVDASLLEPPPFIVGVSDRIRINVWGHDDLGSEVTVRPDGKVTTNLAGDISAAGKTPKALAKVVAGKLKEFIKDPQVTVTVVEIKSYRFTVSGEVRTPGVFTSARYVTVLDAIVLAGGLTRFAEREKIEVVRITDDGQETIPVSYDAILEGETEFNFYIHAGDVLVVR